MQNDGFYNRGDDEDVINSNRSYYGPVDIKKLHIRVMDEYGRIANWPDKFFGDTTEEVKEQAKLAIQRRKQAEGQS